MSVTRFAFVLLASLALALSLSDHVVELAVDGASHLDTLFIDEGFGTLDAETLQIVAAALHELAALLIDQHCLDARLDGPLTPACARAILQQLKLAGHYPTIAARANPDNASE